MLRSFLLVLLSMTVLHVNADQQTVLSSADAERTVSFLKTQDEIVLFCGCCSNDEYAKVILTEVSFECEYIDWCKVRVQGTNSETQETVNTTIDLAYAWINKNGVARNLAWEMELNASPCAKPFNWDNYELIEGIEHVSINKSDTEAFETNYNLLKRKLEMETGFQRKSFESSKQFVVEEIKLEKDWLNHKITISYIGSDMEQRYTIPLNKIGSLTKNEEGIEIKTVEDGVVMIEEFENTELNYRSFYFVATIQIPNVELSQLKNFEIMVDNHDAMTK